MHSNATPNCPFIAIPCTSAPSGETTLKPNVPVARKWRSRLTWKSLLLLLLLFGWNMMDGQAQTQTKRVYADHQVNDVVTTGLGVCVLCNVAKPDSAIDVTGTTFLNTAAVLNAGVVVGLGNVVVYEDLIFPAGQTPTGAMPGAVKVGVGSALSAALFGGITIQAYNGASPVGSPVPASEAILNLLASGNQAEIFLPAPGAAYDRIRVSINGGLLSAAVSILVYAGYYDAPATGAIACDAPIDVLYGRVGALATLGSISGVANAVDGNPTTFAQLNTTAGTTLLNSYAQLTAIYPGLSKSGDSVRIILSNSGVLLSADVLDAITIVTYNRNTVVDSIRGNSSLLKINLLSGSSGPQTMTFASAGQFDHIQVRFGSVVSALATLNVNEIQRMGPAPATGGVSKTTCLNTTPFTLDVLSPDNTNLNYTWYDSTNTQVGTGSSFSPATNTAGSFRYYVSATRKTCTTESAKALVTLVVTAAATAADITLADTTIACVSNTAVLNPTSTTVTTPVFKWYKNADRTGPVTNGLTEGAVTYAVDAAGKLTITGLTAGNHTYYASVSGTNYCENEANALKAAVVKVVTAPASPVVTGDVVVATGQPATLTAAAVPGATITWYADGITPTPAGTGTSFVVGPFTNPGTYTYYASVNIAGACASARVAVNVVVTGPVIPSPDCNVPTSQASGTTLGCVLCSVTDPTADIDNITTNFTHLNIPVGLLGGSVYQQLIFPASGAAGDSVMVNLAAPGGLADVSLFGGVVITLYNNSTVVKTETLSQLLTLRVLSGDQFAATVAATAPFNRVEVKLTGVATLLTSIDIYGARIFYANPTINAPNTSVCINNKTTLSVTPAAGTTVRWYATATGGTVLSSLNTYTTDSLKTAGTVTYYVEVVGANSCANPTRVPVNVTVTPAGTAADITLADTTIACVSNTAVLNPTSTTVTTPVFKWYKNADRTGPITNGLTEGAVTYAVDAAGKLTITGLAAGNHTYYASVSGTNYCENEAGALKAAVVKVVTAPATPVVTGDVVVATGQPATLTAAAVPGATITWYADGITPTPAGTGTSFVVGPFTNPGTYTYYASVNIAGACASARVAVNVVVTGPVIPSPDCNVPTSQASGTTLGCILCSVTDPTADIDNVTTNFTHLSMPVGLLGGSVYQRLIFPTPGSAGDSVRVVFAAPGGLADVSLFGGVVVTLYNNGTLVKAETLSQLLTLRVLSGNQFAATVAATAPYDRVEVRLTGVANLLNAIDIYGARILYANPIINTTTDTVCINNKATLSVIPAAGTTVRWYATATGGTVLSSLNTYTTDTLKTAGTVTYYVEVVGANGCANPTRVPVSVTVSPAPVVPGPDATINLCPGSDASLTIPTPDRTMTYRWYNVATGGTKLNTDSGYVFKALAINRDTTFFVEAVSSCGAVSPRQAVHLVMSSSLSAPAVAPNPDSVNIGTQAVLTAFTPASNAIYTWYGSQAGNDSLFTGPTYSPPTRATAGTVIYWVQASISGGGSCQSIRVPVTVVYGAFNNPTPVPCEGATSQTIGGSGLLILGNVYNPALAVDNDASTGASLVINLGALNAQVWERVKFNGVSVPGDTVRVLLSSPSQVLAASLLGGVQLTTYNGTTPGDSVMANNPLIKLVLLSSSRQAILEFVPTHPFDAIEVKLKSGIVGALTTIDFNYAQRALVQPKVQAAEVTVCAGNTTTLGVQNPVTGITYRWYTANGNYLAGKDGATFTTGVLTADSSFFVEAFRNGCASKGRAKVAVKVAAAPAAPVVQATDVKVCAGSDAVLAVATPAKGYSYNWYNVANGGTKLNTDSGFTYKVVNVTAQAIYYVEAVNDSCNTVSATRTAVTVGTASSLASPVVTPAADTVIVNQQPVFTATASSANAEFYWFASQASTDTLFKGAIFAAPASATLGTITYWVEAALPGAASCKSARIPVNAVTVTDIQNPVPCEGATSQTIGGSGLLVLGNVYNPQLAVDNSANTASSLVINLGVLNATVWQRAFFNGLSTPGDTVKVMLSNPGQILSAAVLASVQLTTYSGNVPGDSVLVSNPLVHLNLLSGGKRALLYFVPTKPFDGVEVKLKSGIVGALTEIGFNYAQRAIVQPTVQVTNAAICKGTQATLSVVNPVSGVVYSWFDGQGHHLLDSIAYMTPATLDSGTYTYTVRATRNGCQGAASAPAQITVQGTPAAPVIAASAISICVGDSATLTIQNAINTVTYRWYTAATGGALLFTGPVYVVKGLTASADFYAEASSGNCSGGARTKVSIGVGTAPVPILDANQVTVCEGGTAILKVTSSVNNVTYNWYTTATGGTSIFTGPIFTTPVVNATTKYYVEAVGDINKCGKPSTRAVATVNTVPVPAAPAVISANVNTCVGQATTLAVKNPQAGVTYQWFDAATGGTLVFTGPVFNVTADSSRTYYVQALVGNGCPSATRTAAAITASSVPTAPVIAASSLFVCQGGSVTLAVQKPASGVTYRWFDAATGGNLLFTGANYITGALNASTDFYAEASNGNCSNAIRTKVSIGAGQAPTPVLESNSLTVCQGGTATLRVVSATNGITYKWYTVATGGTAVFTGPDYTTGTLTNSIDFYVEATGDIAQCGNPSARVKASVTVVSAPAAPDVMAASLKTCAGTGITVAVKTQQPGLTYQWFDAATGGSLLFTGPVYNVPVVNNNTTYFVQAVVGTGCTSATRTPVSVTVDPAPSIPSIATGDVVTCIGGTATFSVQNPDAALTYRWYDAPSNGMLLATGTAYTTAPLGLTTAFYLEATNNAGCSSARKGVKATVVTTIDAPLADPITICSGQTGILSVKNKVNGVIYNWYTLARGGASVFTGADFTITPTVGATYYLEAATSGGCVSASRTVVIVTVNPSPAVPAVANATIEACQGQTATLNALNPDATLTYKWYTTPTGGTPAGTGASFITPVITANQMYYLEATNNNGCPSASRTAVSVNVTPSPASPMVTGNEAGVCPGSTATLTATSNAAGADFRWYNSSTGGTPLFTGAVFTTPAITANTTYYVEVFTTGGCASTARTAAAVVVLQPLATPVVTVDITTATSITFRWNAITGAQRYEVTLDNGVTFIPPSSGANGTTHTVTGLQPNQNVTLQVRAIGASTCQNSALSAGVTGTTANPQGNNIFVPNLFSPNGDGVNDVHLVYGTAIAQLEFRIYNQWGQLVFTSKDQRQGWDGTMGGQKQPVGVYVYIVKATMQDGSVITKKGNVTLMR
ncbi:gliding motility-associated C-terminal domain-containing protein [Chitinophaga sp. MM2321]|uniref:Ig-like domain-containing protein n=1 Tax=Chitinophaga sp. MM2321 TaxID=3137178 RepID=UPI0032D59F99